jgi:hypothetical protein
MQCRAFEISGGKEQPVVGSERTRLHGHAMSPQEACASGAAELSAFQNVQKLNGFSCFEQQFYKQHFEMCKNASVLAYLDCPGLGTTSTCANSTVFDVLTRSNFTSNISKCAVTHGF